MKGQSNLKVIGASIILCILVLFVELLMTYYNQIKLNASHENKYNSRLLATELANNSAGLTNAARAYVVTGNPKYEKIYWDILAVQNGKKPRSDGRTIALKDLMRLQGFTEEEFNKLQQAEQNSNGLVRTETIAMNAVKGQFEDSSGQFTIIKSPDMALAQRLMHDEKYHIEVENIMKPILEFNSMLDKRTHDLVEWHRNVGNYLLIGIGLFIMATAVLMILFGLQGLRLVAELADKISSSSSSAGDACDNILSTSKNLEASVVKQSVAINQTAASVEQVNAMVSKNSESAQLSRDYASQSRELADQGQRNVNDMIRSIDDIDESNKSLLSAVEESNRNISDIVKVINKIAEKTKVINDIVFQTKLLSFNASVEAARAAESGKGFSVVAEEIGTLATMSGNASVEIQALVSDSVKQVNQSVESTKSKMTKLIETSSDKVNTGSAVARQCGESLRNIVISIEKVSTIASEIAQATAEQSRGVAEITNAMNQINAVTSENSSNATMLKEYSEKMQVDSQSLQGVVVELSSFTKGSTLKHRVAS